MDAVILDNISFQIDVNNLKEKFHIRENSDYVDDLERLIHEAQTIGKPKTLYKMAFIESKGDDSVTINGITLKSRVLRINLEQTYRIFSFVATCGIELDNWANGITDMLERYWAETIKEIALRIATNVLKDHLVEHYQLGGISRMSPGSLADWPIKEQRPLFAILGNIEDLIGVYLNESLMMIPTKSLSGIWFPTEISFISCQLCSRELCPGRRAPYDKDLYDRKYRKKTN